MKMSCCNTGAAAPSLDFNWYISYSFFRNEKKIFRQVWIRFYFYIYLEFRERKFRKKNVNELLSFLSSYLHLCQGIICSRVINHYSVAPLLEMEFQKCSIFQLTQYTSSLCSQVSLFKRPKKNDLIMLIPPDFQLNLNWIGLSLKPWYITHSPTHV